jgi:hypothetical protein
VISGYQGSGAVNVQAVLSTDKAAEEVALQVTILKERLLKIIPTDSVIFKYLINVFFQFLLEVLNLFPADTSDEGAKIAAMTQPGFLLPAAVARGPLDQLINGLLFFHFLTCGDVPGIPRHTSGPPYRWLCTWGRFLQHQLQSKTDLHKRTRFSSGKPDICHRS